jgi:signal transduction histidine kinase
MRLKKINISSGGKLLSAFSASLLIVIVIGFIGIFQIKFLFNKVEILGSGYLPVQAAVSELKVANNLYAMAVRNYVLWKSSRYLEAARTAADFETVDKVYQDFTRRLKVYSLQLDSIKQGQGISYTWVAKHKQWVQEISSYKQELQAWSLKIADFIESQQNPQTINMALMEFESVVYRIDEFISETVQKDIMRSVQGQLLAAEQAKNRAVTFLGWSLILGVLVGAQTARLVYKNLKREFNRRKRIVLDMIRTEERERQHLSAQVHDQMSQDLSALSLYLGLIQKDSRGSNLDLDEKIRQSQGIVSGLLDKAHNISLLLRPPSLDEIGLNASLEALVSDYSRITEINIYYKKTGVEICLSPETSLYLYRFVQEALTNAVKYSQAENVSISLNFSKTQVELVYEDNGKGFDYERVIKETRRRTEDKVRLGLLSLQERAEILGGSMQVEASSGKGTRITLRLNC